MRAVPKNLRIAFPHLNIWQRRLIVVKFYLHIIRCLWQWLWLEKINRNVMGRCLWSVPLEEILDWKGIDKEFILCTGHFGNWEIANLIGKKIFRNYVVIVKEQRTWIGKYLSKKREKVGLKLWVVGEDERKMLEEGRQFCIATVIDHHVRDGIKVKFFSKGCFFPRGVVRFAKKFGHKVLPVFVVCKGRNWLIEVVGQPVSFYDFPSQEEFAQYLTSCLEDMVIKYPHQYLWTFKRWKHSWELKIGVLMDGRMGHRNQSLAFVEGIKHRLCDKDVEVEFVDLSGIERSFTKRVISFLCGVLPIEIGEILVRLFFSKQKKALLNRYYDVILSTGSSLVGLNVFLKRYNWSKSVVIMDPGVIWRRKVNLIVAPLHDEIKGKNVVESLGAVSWFDEERAERIAKDKGIPEIDCCILIGGICKGEWNRRKLLEFLDCISELSKDIAITTSPRTPDWLEEEIDRRRYKFKFCCVYSKDACRGVVLGMLKRTKKVICTSDSISMISEALASGRKVGIWVSGIDISRKHTKFLEALDRKKGVVLLFDVEQVKRFLDGGEELRKVNNSFPKIPWERIL